MKKFYRVGMKLVKELKPLTDNLSLTDFRRRSIRAYALEQGEPFEYALSRGLGLGLILGVLVIIYAISSKMSIAMGAIGAFVALFVGTLVQFVEMERLIKVDQREIGIQFSRFSSNCALFISSGMSVRHAFIKSAGCLDDCRSTRQIMIAVKELEMSLNTSEVFENLNTRLRHPMVAEFTSVLVQMERYGSSSKSDLDRVIQRAWQSRRQIANLSAKEMETKLVFPSMLIFFGVMLMITAAMLMQLMNM